MVQFILNNWSSTKLENHQNWHIELKLCYKVMPINSFSFSSDLLWIFNKTLQDIKHENTEKYIFVPGNWRFWPKYTFQ